MSEAVVNVRVVVKIDVEATKKLLAELLAEPEPAPYEDVEPDYEYMPVPWCRCDCH